MFNENYQFNHSNIINYPIDYNIFPLAKKTKIIKVELNENQYLHIPAYWSHWVYTEPRTIALSFDIKNILGKHDYKSEIQHKIMQRIPYKKNGKKNKFNYDNFISNSLKYTFNAICSDIEDVSPVFKNEKQKKFFIRDTLLNLTNTSLNDNYYVYIYHTTTPTGQTTTNEYTATISSSNDVNGNVYSKINDINSGNQINIINTYTNGGTSINYIPDTVLSTPDLYIALDKTNYNNSGVITLTITPNY